MAVEVLTVECSFFILRRLTSRIDICLERGNIRVRINTVHK